MLVRFFFAFSIFSFLWVFLEANPQQKREDDWVLQGLDQMVDQLDGLVQKLNRVVEDKPGSMNLFVFTILEKEQVASNMSQVLNDYFLVDRFKPNSPGIEEKLTVVHELLFLLQAVKSSNDVNLVDKLRKSLRGLRRSLQQGVYQHRAGPHPPRPPKSNSLYRPPRRGPKRRSNPKCEDLSQLIEQAKPTR